MWPRFCKALEREDLIEHPDYASPALRLTNLAAMNAEIEAITAKQPSAHWIEVMNAAGIPCGPIYSIDQMFADPQIEHLKVYDEVDSAALGRIKLMAQPVRLSRTPSHVDRAAQEYSEHVDEILEGHTAHDVGGLKAAGGVFGGGVVGGGVAGGTCVPLSRLLVISASEQGRGVMGRVRPPAPRTRWCAARS